IGVEPLITGVDFDALIADKAFDNDDSAELLDSLEGVLDQVTPLVHLGVVRDRRFAIRLRRDDGDGASFIQYGSQSDTPHQCTTSGGFPSRDPPDAALRRTRKTNRFRIDRLAARPSVPTLWLRTSLV